MLSKELQKAIDDAWEKCLAAVNYVGAANYRGREAEAIENVNLAFDELIEAIKQEPQRRFLVKWREEVARGGTTLGFDDWRKENEQ